MRFCRDKFDFIFYRGLNYRFGFDLRLRLDNLVTLTSCEGGDVCAIVGARAIIYGLRYCKDADTLQCKEKGK